MKAHRSGCEAATKQSGYAPPTMKRKRAGLDEDEGDSLAEWSALKLINGRAFVLLGTIEPPWVGVEEKKLSIVPLVEVNIAIAVS